MSTRKFFKRFSYDRFRLHAVDCRFRPPAGHTVLCQSLATGGKAEASALNIGAFAFSHIPSRLYRCYTSRNMRFFLLLKWGAR